MHKILVTNKYILSHLEPNHLVVHKQELGV